MTWNAEKEVMKCNTKEELHRWFLRWKAYERMKTFRFKDVTVLDETELVFRATFHADTIGGPTGGVFQASNFGIQSTFGGINIYQIPN